MSTIYNAKVACKALLEGWTGWPTRAPTFRWVEPTKLEHFPRLGEVISFGAAAPIDIPTETLSLGRRSYDEEGTLRLILQVLRSGDDPQGVEARADELYDQIVLALSSDPRLGGTVSRMQGWSVNRQVVPLDGKWLADFVIEQTIVGAERPLPNP